jgi:2-oxoglutarate dehydrogenase E1 component
VIDLVGYRRLGHNEADEPSATQPLMYAAIREHPSTRTLYGRKLIEAGVITQDGIDQMAEGYRAALDEGRNPNQAALGMIGNQFTVDWSRYTHASLADPVNTSLADAELQRLAGIVNNVPATIKLHPRVQRIVDERRRMAAGEVGCDWGFAETLAYASLLAANFHVRLIGQDSRRGTFFHRHAALIDQNTGEAFVPLAHVAADPRAMVVSDSLLSEEAVLGFEYGYSTTSPDTLVIWEAQFGDFANGAQVVIDQFISSGEAKWGRLSGLTLFLPHGYEGQGPEHSSARLERFLSLGADHNIQVVDLTTPAQYFHVLRRQVKRRWRKPLIVMTPKSLLRHPRVVSDLDELASGRFQRVIADSPTNAGAIDRVLLCTGKIYYELLAEREERGRDDVAIIRLEQLYPLPEKELYDALASFRDGTPVMWVQEEPANMGAWQFLRVKFGDTLDDRFPFSRVSRPESASPSTGSHASHKLEQQDLLTQAFSEAGSLVGK